MASNKNKALDYILGGGPIEEFNCVGEPTYRDVLRYYSSFWGVNESDTSKATRVSRALISLYTKKNIKTLNELTIGRKIHKQILSLKKILKFKSKVKTQANIRTENDFKTQLSNIFQISKSIAQSSGIDNVVPMDIDIDDPDRDSISAPGD